MRIVDPETGRIYIEKRRRRYDEPGEARELTFSCYRHYPFLSRERTREWFREALEDARLQFGFQLWAYVLMPEHVHLLINPGDAPDQVSPFLQVLKEPVARKAIAYLKANAPGWLSRLTVREGRRVRHRF
jgi:putative transposase